MKNKVRSLFNRSPLLIQKKTADLYSRLPDRYKFGKGYRTANDILKMTRSYNEEQLKEFQFDSFLFTYRNAIKRIPFYRKWYGDFGLNENSIKSPEDISRLPLLDKTIIKKNLAEMVQPLYPKKGIKFAKTSGTTGQATAFYTSKFSTQIETSFIHNIWSRLGYSPNDFKIAFKESDKLEFKNGVHQYYDPIQNSLCLSIYHLNKDTILQYTNLIKTAKPKFYWGYPTAIFAFAQLVDELDIELPNPKGILCGSQMIMAGQRSFLERMFGCRVFTWYGMSERVILASECEHSTNYHIVPEYGYTEILNGTNAISEADTVGELVGTGFYNDVMPLIRYRTGDLASYCINDNCRCNRHHKLLNTIKGRTQDLIILSDDTLRGISGDSPDLAILLDYSRGYQFVQNTPGMIELFLIPKDNNPLDYKERIYKSLNIKYFALVDLVIHEADKLVTSESGKTKFLVQNLDIQNKE